MKKNKGFTLVELAVTLLIIGLLMGGLMMGLTAQIEQRRYNDTQKGIEDIKDALIGYAIQHGHLPCPDKITAAGAGIAPNLQNDGQEDVKVGGACVTQVGNIPWATLGVSDLDAWGHRFHYAVTAAYSDRATVFKQSSLGTLTVCQTATAASACINPIASNLPAVILSFGPNGKGAITSTGVQIPVAAAPPFIPPVNNADEYQNSLPTATVFVSRPKSASGGVLGEFDDQVGWLSSAILVTKMTNANVPPAP